MLCAEGAVMTEFAKYVIDCLRDGKIVMADSVIDNLKTLPGGRQRPIEFTTDPAKCPDDVAEEFDREYESSLREWCDLISDRVCQRHAPGDIDGTSKARLAVDRNSPLRETQPLWPIESDGEDGWVMKPLTGPGAEDASQLVRCDCGAEKCKTTHANWCSTRKNGGEG